MVIYARYYLDYPDTTDFYNQLPNPILSKRQYRINPGSENISAVEDDDGCFESIIESKSCPSDTLIVFLFSEESLLENDWVDAPTYVLRRYDLTLEELFAMNWTITFP